MDRTTKSILILTVTSLVLIMLMMIGNKLILKKTDIQTLKPVESGVVLERTLERTKEVEEKRKIESITGKLRKTREEKIKARQERIAEGIYIPPEERVSPADHSPQLELDPMRKFPPDAFVPGEYTPDDIYPPDYLPPHGNWPKPDELEHEDEVFHQENRLWR